MEVKASGSIVPFDFGMVDFNSFLNAAGLFDHPFGNCQFALSNKRAVGFQKHKLDRVLVNELWLLWARLTVVEFLQPRLSDHTPALVTLGRVEASGPRPFKFF